MTYQLEQDWFTEVAAGRIAGWSVVHKFGRNDALGTTEETVWLAGGTYVWRASAGKVNVTSTSAADATAGAGAQTITLAGLDATFAEISEELTLNGTNAVKGVNDYVRIHRAFCTRVGAYSGANSGTISCAWSVSPTTAFTFVPGHGQSQVAFYTVPLGKEAFIHSVSINVAATTNRFVDLKLYQRPNADDVTTPFEGSRIVLEFDGLQGNVGFKPKTPLWFQPKTDLWWAGAASAGTPAVSVDFEILLHDV